MITSIVGLAISPKHNHKYIRSVITESVTQGITSGRGIHLATLPSCHQEREIQLHRLQHCQKDSRAVLWVLCCGVCHCSYSVCSLTTKATCSDIHRISRCRPRVHDQLRTFASLLAMLSGTNLTFLTRKGILLYPPYKLTPLDPYHEQQKIGFDKNSTWMNDLQIKP